jgi:hypothetical protein
MAKELALTEKHSNNWIALKIGCRLASNTDCQNTQTWTFNDWREPSTSSRYRYGQICRAHSRSIPELLPKLGANQKSGLGIAQCSGLYIAHRCSLRTGALGLLPISYSQSAFAFHKAGCISNLGIRALCTKIGFKAKMLLSRSCRYKYWTDRPTSQSVRPPKGAKGDVLSATRSK